MFISGALFSFTRQRSKLGPLVLHIKTAPFIAQDLATANADAAQVVEQDGFLTFQFRRLVMAQIGRDGA